MIEPQLSTLRTAQPGDGMSLSFDPKDPDEVLDYKLDWTERLAGDTIVSSMWQASPAEGLVIDRSSFTTTETVVWLSEGTIGASYLLLNRVQTDGGRTFDQTVKLRIKSK